MKTDIYASHVKVLYHFPVDSERSPERIVFLRVAFFPLVFSFIVIFTITSRYSKNNRNSTRIKIHTLLFDSTTTTIIANA